MRQTGKWFALTVFLFATPLSQLAAAPMSALDSLILPSMLLCNEEGMPDNDENSSRNTVDRVSHFIDLFNKGQVDTVRETTQGFVDERILLSQEKFTLGIISKEGVQTAVDGFADDTIGEAMKSGKTLRKASIRELQTYQARLKIAWKQTLGIAKQTNLEVQTARYRLNGKPLDPQVRIIVFFASDAGIVMVTTLDELAEEVDVDRRQLRNREATIVLLQVLQNKIEAGVSKGPEEPLGNSTAGAQNGKPVATVPPDASDPVDLGGVKDAPLVGVYDVYEQWSDGLYRRSQRHGGKAEIDRDGETYTLDIDPAARFSKASGHRFERTTSLEATTPGPGARLIEVSDVDGRNVIAVGFSFHTLYLIQGEPPKSWKLAEPDRRAALPSPRIERTSPIEAGTWRAWIEREAVNPRARAISWRQTVFRQGKEGVEPQKLYEEVSTGDVVIALGEDGTLLVGPVGDWPRFYFPDPVNADNMAVIPLLPPQQWDRPSSPSFQLDKSTWVLGDVLVYGRHVSQGPYLVGFVRFDAARHRIMEQRLVAEISNEPEARASNVIAASFADVKPVRVENYVFWRNCGEKKADPSWRESQIRVIDLRKGHLVSLDSIDPQLLKQHETELHALQVE